MIKIFQNPSSSLLVDFPTSKCAKSKETEEELRKGSIEIRKRSEQSAKLYALLTPNETIKEITQALLVHPNTSDLVKSAITEKQHKCFLFSYPSDGLNIKGYISLPADLTKPIPLLILLRGGNRLFGLPFPGELSTQEGYAVVATTYRDGVSEGKDAFGGDDVNDVVNLIDFLPKLEEKLQVKFHATNKYMIGASRGGMQLFLALGRYPQIQQKIKKVVSISGLLNIVQAVEDRADFRDFVKEDFGYTEDEKGKEWLAKRQPIHYVSKLSKNLPILIAQGTADTRVCLKEGYDMLQALHDAGHTVTYVEIEGGDHVLTNSSDFIPLLMDWLEK